MIINLRMKDCLKTLQSNRHVLILLVAARSRQLMKSADLKENFRYKEYKIALKEILAGYFNYARVHRNAFTYDLMKEFIVHRDEEMRREKEMEKEMERIQNEKRDQKKNRESQEKK